MNILVLFVNLPIGAETIYVLFDSAFDVDGFEGLGAESISLFGAVDEWIDPSKGKYVATSFSFNFCDLTILPKFVLRLLASS